MPGLPGLGYMGPRSGWPEGWRAGPPVEVEAEVDRDRGPDQDSDHSSLPEEAQNPPPARRRSKRKRKGAATEPKKKKQAAPPLPVDGNSERNSDRPHLIPQPGGRGALLSGGLRGNAGGGRPPSTLRVELHALAAGPGKTALAEILADPDARPSDKLKALEMALRYGLGSSDELTVGTMPDTRVALTCLRRALAAQVREVGVEAFVAELKRLLDDQEDVFGPAQTTEGSIATSPPSGTS